MGIGSIALSVNGKPKTTIDAEVYCAAYHAELNQFGAIAAYPLEDTGTELIDAVRSQIRYGEFFLLFFSKEALAYFGSGIASDMESLFGAVRYADAVGDDADYWLFGRRGDLTFVPREGIEARDGKNRTIEVHTSLFEQFGDDGLLFSPVTFAGKKLGNSSPKAHRMLGRRTTDVTASVVDEGTEVTQDEYNTLIRPDMESIQVDTLSVVSEDFLTADIVTSTVPTLWRAGTSGAGTPKTYASGLRIFLGHLLLGPSAMDFAQVNELIENSEAPEAGADAPSAARPVAQVPISDEGGFVVETRFFTTQASPGVGTGYSAAITAYRNGEASFLSWNDGFGIAIRPTLLDGNGDPDPGDTSHNVAIIDGSTGRGSSALKTARIIIKPNTNYHVRLLYNSAAEGSAAGAITLSVWIWEEGFTTTSQPQLSSGSYVPTNRRLDPFSGDAYGQSSDVGVGCENLSLDEYWAFDYLEVRNFNADYAQLIADLDMSGQHEQVEFLMTLRGKGNSLGAEAYGHRVSIWNFSTSLWEIVSQGSYTEDRMNTVRFSVDLLQEYVSAAHIYLLISSPHAQEESPLATAISSRIEMDYLYGRSKGTAKRVFGKTDFYFVQTADLTALPSGSVAYRPSVRQEIVIDSAQDIMMLTPGTAYEDENGAPLALSGPVEELIDVELMQQLDDFQPKYQLLDTLRAGQDYQYFWENPTLRGSMQERLALVVHADFVGLPLRITLRSHNRVKSVHDYFATSGSRKLDADLLARHKRTVFVDVYARYKGSVTGNLTDRLREWIYNFSGNELQTSAIARFLLDEGVTQILLFDGTNSSEALAVDARRIDDNGVVQKQSSLTLLSRAATETFVPGTVKLISIA
jgi:hypothetical protein